MKRNLPIWLTIAIALIAFAAGFLVDRHILTPTTQDRRNPKVKAILDLIAHEYVDTINPGDLMEKSIPLILKGLAHTPVILILRIPRLLETILMASFLKSAQSSSSSTTRFMLNALFPQVQAILPVSCLETV